ncbi:MAG: M20 family metallopeptidase [Bacillota bacterium]|jgi:amidohydrolase
MAIHDGMVAALAEECIDDVISWRRTIHELPEIGFEEVKTAELSAQVLNRLGLEVMSGVAGTGIVATLRGGQPGPTVALRADMDALPLQEETGLPFASRVPGVMHACGHDGHTAMLLGAATVLSRLRQDLKGNVRFLFQPAEERVGGAAPMIAAGALRNPDVDAIFAAHLWPDVPYGHVAVHRGPAMASLDEFTARIYGRGGHVATPHKSVDAIAAAALFIADLQTIVSRELDPTEPAVVSVGRIEGGSAYNAIASEVLLKGTVRVVNPSMRQVICDKMEGRLKGLATSHGVTYDFDYHFGYPPVINSVEMADFVAATAARVLGDGRAALITRPSMVGEDFAYYTQEVPGAIYLLGIGDSDTCCYPLHHPKFNFSESVLGIGVRLLAQLAVDYLKQSDPSVKG